MFKDTCLIAHKRIDRSPCILDLENPSPNHEDIDSLNQSKYNKHVL
jgi:hypothetical protein